MILSRQKVIRSVVPLLVFSISQVYIQASLTTRNTQTQNAQTPATPMVGMLEVHGGKYIKVDNRDTASGATIVDGQVLETSSCVSATVRLFPVSLAGASINQIGKVDLATKTKAVIYYSVGKVRVSLLRGCSRVDALTGLDGSIETPDGAILPAVLQQGTTDQKHAEVCYPSNDNQTYRPHCIPPILWFGVGGGAAGTVAAVVGSRGGNPSSPAPVR